MSEDSFENCPVCDASIPEGEEECPECGAILDLFDIDVEGEVQEEYMGKIMDMVLDENEERELIQDIKDLGLPEDEVPFEDKASGEEEEVEEIITFECPVCESEVEEDAVECPNCGAIFEEPSGEASEAEKAGMEEEIGELGKGFEEEIEKEPEVVDFQEEIESFEQELEKLENQDLHVGYIEDELEELKDAQKENKRKKGEELIESLQKKLGCLHKIEEKIERCERYLKVLRERIDISTLEEKVEEIYEGTEIGEYQAAQKKASEVEEEIKERTHEEGKDWLENLIEEKMESAEDNQEELVSEIDPGYIASKVERVKRAKKDGRIDEAFHGSIKALKSSEKALEISDKIEEAKFYEEKLKQRDVDIDEFKDKIEESLSKLGEVDARKILEEIEETTEEMNERLEKEKEIEKISEERKRKDLFKKIQQKIPKMKSLLKTAKKLDIDTEEGRELINKAVEHTKENDYEKGVETLNECRDLFREKIDEIIDDKIDEFRSLDKEGIDLSDLQLEELNRYEQNRDYERAVELIEETEKKIDLEKEPKDELEQEISRLKNIIDQAEHLDFEIDRAEQLLQEAENEKSRENWSAGREKVNECENDLEKELIDFLKGEIQNAKRELKEAKERGKDVSEPIDLLKKANELQKENDLEGSFRSVKKYKEMMEEMREEL